MSKAKRTAIVSLPDPIRISLTGNDRRQGKDEKNQEITITKEEAPENKDEDPKNILVSATIGSEDSNPICINNFNSLRELVLQPDFTGNEAIFEKINAMKGIVVDHLVSIHETSKIKIYLIFFCMKI